MDVEFEKREKNKLDDKKNTCVLFPFLIVLLIVYDIFK